MSNQFVVHRLRAHPVEYTVTLKHFVSGGEWQMGLSVNGVMLDSEEDKKRVAYDLRWAADAIEADKLEPVK